MPDLMIERVQTGVRLEKRLLKVLKALAELKDMSLGDLIEGMALHAFEGKCAFDRETVDQISALKKVYGLQLDAASSQNLGGQPATGEGLTPPTALGGSDYELTVPVESGTTTETYRVTLAPEPASLAEELSETAGVGHLF